MGIKKDNIKALLSNTRTRVVILFTFGLLMIAVLIGLYKFFYGSNSGSTASAEIASTPGGIQSIPGAINPTAQYSGLQEEQNIRQAKEALNTGASAIPTIVRVQAFGQGGTGLAGQQGPSGVGFSMLALEEQGGQQRSLWVQQLKDGHCTKLVINKVLSEGADDATLKQGCTCQALHDAGLSLKQLKKICSCESLRMAGVSALAMKEAGFDSETLRICGYNTCDMHAAGFTAQQLKDAGYSDGELKGAGYSQSDIDHASGIPEGMTLETIRKAGTDPAALQKLREAGVSASALRRIDGLDAKALKAAGYNAADLKRAGFTAAQLKAAGFNAAELKRAGFSPEDLLTAGFTPAALEQAGFMPNEIHAAEYALPTGITETDVKKAGCDAARLAELRKQGVTAQAMYSINHCSADALKAAGFSPESLLQAGFTPQDLQKAGFTPAQVEAALNSPAGILAQLARKGCDPVLLQAAHQAGISAAELVKVSDCSLSALKTAGYSAAELKRAGFTAAQLKVAGFDAAQLKAAGFTAKELKEAGFTALALKQVGFSATELKAAGFSVFDLKAAGLTASALKAAGFKPDALKAAGFSAADLKAAGFSASQLKTAGFDAQALKAAGFNPSELKAAGFTAADLKDAGFSASELRQAGFSPEDLRSAGFNEENQNASGVDDTQGLTNANMQKPFSPAQLNKLLLAQQEAHARELDKMMARQHKLLQEQKYQQKIDQRAAQMQAAASEDVQIWSKVNTQTYVSGSEKEKGKQALAAGAEMNESDAGSHVAAPRDQGASGATALIKTGDILFGVIDTSINSDEPGPILATIVSGRFKGAKLIGNFNLPGDADKMTISFNIISIPGAPKTTSISAYAIDPDTARTALSGRTNHHYLMRYGSLFASSFMQGFGNAFQSANTTVTVGGTGGGTNFTVQNGIGRSVLENAVISLAAVGKDWGRVAQKNMNRPTTVEVYAGTPIGILFTQDLTSL